MISVTVRMSIRPDLAVTAQSDGHKDVLEPQIPMGKDIAFPQCPLEWG